MQQSSAPLPITFEWKLPSGHIHTSEVEATPAGLRAKTVKEVYPATFLSAAAQNPTETAQRFSDLSRRQRHRPVIDAVAALFPEVEDLSVEILAGSNVLHASVRGISERIAVGALSAGVNKYVSILLAIAANPTGVVIIDEIENGIYFQMLPRAWEAMISFAERNQVQLFASTHSKEFLSSLLPSLAGREKKLCILQISRKGPDSHIRTFDGHHLKSALEQEVEIR